MRARYYIGNLPYSVGESRLTDELNFLGLEVSNLRIVNDKDTGHSKGYGFFETEVENVQERASDLEIEGRKIRVSVAERQPRQRANREFAK